MNQNHQTDPVGSLETQVFQERSAKASDSDPCLILIAHPTHDRLGTRFPIPATKTTVGRHPDNDVAFPEVATVSRRHAVFELTDGRVQVSDLGSTNHTRVNGREIERPTFLLFGDRIQLGQIHLKFLAGPDVERSYHELVYRLAHSDPLTGIGNRRRIDEELSRQIELCRRRTERLSMIVFDIDEFKQLNDTYGHPAGDIVLRKIATLCDRELRKESVLARMGGDEFGILCPGTELTEATDVARRLCKAIRALRIAVKSENLSVTCSFGVAELSAEASTPAELQAKADRALYEAKRLGRDRVQA